MALKINPMREKRAQIEACISKLIRSYTFIEKEVGLWGEIAEAGQESEIIKDKISTWQSTEQERINSLREIEMHIASIGNISKPAFHRHPDADLITDYEKKKADEELEIRVNFLQQLYIKPSKVITIYTNPYIKENALQLKLRNLLSSHDYMVFIPKEKSGDTSKMYTLIHTPTLSVCNLNFEIHIARQPQNQQSQAPAAEAPVLHSLILTDLSFHMLLEPLSSNSTVEKLEPDFIQSHYSVVGSKKSNHCSDILLKALGSRDVNIEFRQTSSSLDMYNVMSKLVRSKYRTAGSTGTVPPGLLVEKIIDIIDRYMKFLPKMVCTECGRGIVYNPASGKFIYPFLNYGETFLHQTCTNEKNIGLFV
jgi:hypothetical protein